MYACTDNMLQEIAKCELLHVMMSSNVLTTYSYLMYVHLCMTFRYLYLIYINVFYMCPLFAFPFYIQYLCLHLLDNNHQSAFSIVLVDHDSPILANVCCVNH